MEEHQVQSNQSSQKDIFSHIPSRQAFWLGFIAAILCLGTLGFIILGSQLLKGESLAFGGSVNAAIDDSDLPVDDTEDTIPAGAVPVVTADDHIRGDVNAPITIIEYSDFECPFCSQFHPTMQQVMTDYDGQVRWIFRHFPLSFHPDALPAANAAECAGEQGRFWEYGDALFENQTSLGDELYEKLAVDLKINTTQFNTCLSSNKFKSKIETQAQEGGAAGVSGTPGSFIIGEDGSAIPIRGALPYSSIKAAIDELL